MKKILDWNKYLETAAKAAAEGTILLKNDNSALPLNMDETVSVFGRIQLHYYKSGTGSGGMVNVSKVTGIVDGLLDNGVRLNDELLDVYKKWDEKNPFDLGDGWGGEPWSQKEMPLDDELVENAAKKGSTAIVIIGRTAGEEMDASLTEGSFLLTELEREMLSKVKKAFEKLVVILNVGGLIDMSFVDEYTPDAVLYAWQGGMTGGTGTADVLTGKVSPSGKLPDTIAYNVEDYPSYKYFGDKDKNFYSEDIFVGYRWFETFAPEKVRYPFGFGLSYSNFEVKTVSVSCGDVLTFKISVTNTGEYSGKEVVQIYCESPQGKLGKASKVLCGFDKTNELAPNETQELTIEVSISDIASYDDSGASDNKSCWVLEAGAYNFYVGTDVRSAESVYTFEKAETEVIEACSQALAPVESFERVTASFDNGNLVPVMKNVPLNEVDEYARRMERLPKKIAYTGDKGIKLADVKNGKNTMDEFLAQLSDYDLTCIIRGEGMGSPRVTAGTASAFGGVSDALVNFGIPAACCDDGPSGMRLDCGTKAFSLPNGTMLASTFNKELSEELFYLLGLEMSANKVDCLLGPGMNIHRHPLNGRNFEYFSEDPFLTGHMAAAQLKGMHNAGVTGTIKHFCANNQETNRHFLDSAVSERALREIYLKGFEIAVKEGSADSVMTSYGSVNGVWTAGNFDLNTVILREEWGFTGFTMTDWWANSNFRGEEPKRSYFVPMAIAQNDVYMVCADCACVDENLETALSDGTLTRAELQRNAANICNFIIGTNAMKRLCGEADEIEVINRPEDSYDSDEPVVFYNLDGEFMLDLTGVKTEKGRNYSFAFNVETTGIYKVTITASSTQSELAQIPVSIFLMGTASGTFTWNGTNGKPVSIEDRVPMFSRFTAVRLYFAQSGLDLHSIKFELIKHVENIEVAFKKEDLV